MLTANGIEQQSEVPDSIIGMVRVISGHWLDFEQ
jgi:hypothetical protein